MSVSRRDLRKSRAFKLSGHFAAIEFLNSMGLIAMLKSAASQIERLPALVHVHVCVHCGHARRREEVDGREVGSGILHCPSCEADGPLNIEIRTAAELAVNRCA